jgi:quinoprotein glucose dehydrogenase
MEKASPTQPFVTKPPAYDRQGFSLDDVIDWTPELRAEAVKLVSRYKIGPLFTPPVVSRWEGPLGTIMLPSTGGGANWPGGAFDPETKMLYVHSTTTPAVLGLIESDGKRSDMAFIRGSAPDPTARAAVAATTAAAAPAAGGGEGAGPALTVQGLPIIKPPYGRITAFDMNRGEIVWQVAHGETPDNIRNHPALKGITIPRTGRPGRIGMVITKSLVVSGEPGFFTTPNGQRGAMLRAYNKATGAEVGSVFMPAPQTGSPMTYMLGGKQYIVVAIAGGNYSAELVAFRLPNEK